MKTFVNPSRSHILRHYDKALTKSYLILRKILDLEDIRQGRLRIVDIQKGRVKAGRRATALSSTISDTFAHGICIRNTRNLMAHATFCGTKAQGALF